MFIRLPKVKKKKEEKSKISIFAKSSDLNQNIYMVLT